METHAAEFLQCLPDCSQRLAQWLQDEQFKELALSLACELVKHLQEHSKPTWQVFMPSVFQALRDKDPDKRIPSAYLINVAAKLPDFGEAAPEAFRQLAQVVSAPAPKKRDERAHIASDNAVAALLVLTRCQASHCPPESSLDTFWQLIVSKLPLKADPEEARMVHKAIADLLLQQDEALLGPNAAHLGKVLSSLAEAYHQSEMSTKEIDESINLVFQRLPQSKLLEVSSSFSEKQQKKIQRMLAVR
jgi:hypothetical protein